MGRLEQTPPQPPQWPLVSILHRVRFIELSSLCSILNLSHTAPSAAPTSVNVPDVTSSNITVQWGAVDCIHHNGDITGYSVRYGVQGTAEGDRTVKMATGDSSGGMYTISGLSAATVYTVEVAAVNSAGTGVYSDLTTAETRPSNIYNLCGLLC